MTSLSRQQFSTPTHVTDRGYYFSHIRGNRLHLTSPYGDRTLCGKQRPWMTDNSRGTFEGDGRKEICPTCRAKAKQHTGVDYKNVQQVR